MNKKSIAIQGLRIMNRFTKKKMNQVCFMSSPDFSCNPRGMFDYLYEHKKDEFTFVWLVEREDTYELIQREYPDVLVYYKNKKDGIRAFMHSYYVFTNHLQYHSISNHHQLFIDLWHGMPLKRIGFMVEDTPELYLDRPVKKIATSTLMQMVMSASFYVNPLDILISGQPRTDVFFNEARTKETIHRLEKILGVTLSTYKKVVLYSPTHRLDDQNIELNEYNRILYQNDIFLKDYDYTSLIEYLEKENILFLMKHHPYNEKYHQIINTSHLIQIQSTSLRQERLDINSILPLIDVLVTDYSSVYIDYLLLNKKILFLHDPLENYDSRGFCLEPFDYFTPGVKIDSQTDLMFHLKEDEDPMFKQREIVTQMIYQHIDGLASERIYNKWMRK